MKPSHKSDDVCIGLSIEGDLLRLAAVGREGKNLHVLDVASMPIPVQQHVTHEKDDGGANPFDRADMGDGDEMDYTAVKDFLSGHYIPGATVAVSLGDHNIRTFLTTSDPKDSPKKVINHLLSEVQHSLNLELGKDQISYERIGKTGIVASARIENSPLLEVFALPHGASRRGTRINFVTSADIAIVNLVRVHFRFRDDSIVHIVHVAKDETKLFIMRGYDLVYIAPPIQQGANDRDYVTMLNNRLELAAENAGYSKADAVVLSGYAEEIGLKEEMLENDPGLVFHSLARLRVSHGPNEALARELPRYAVPISVAWQQLQPKNPHFYKINLIPSRIREEQKKAKLAWHGLLLLVLLFVAATGLTIMSLQKQERIRTEQAQLNYERKQINEQRAIVAQINELEERSSSLVAATNTLDTLLMNSEKYSDALDTLARAAGGLRNIWINEMKPDADGNISVVGFSVTRPSIPSFSSSIGTTNLREISVQQIGDKKVYRYDVALMVPDLYPSSGSPATAWHDTIRTTLGDVSSRFTATKEKETKKAGKSKGKGKSKNKKG